jgi:hypothetical protein
MDNQFLNYIAFAGFAGFVAGVVITWIVAKSVAFSRHETIRETVIGPGTSELKRLAGQHAAQMQTIAEAHRLALNATADLNKANDLLRQAEDAVRSSTAELTSMSAISSSSSRAANSDAEPLRPRKARTA